MIETDHRGEEVVKIVDFGLAKMGEGSERLTRAGELWGSSFYMSPEQCNGSESDARSDIYSFGIVMYQMLTGKVPFRGSGFMETVSKQLSEPPPPLKMTKADLVLPDMTERILFKCLEKAPGDRFQNVADLKSALQSALPEPVKPEKDLSSRPARPIGAPRPAPKKEKAKPKEASQGSHMKGLIVLFVVLIVCCIAVFFVLTNHKSNQAPKTVAPASSTPITKESIGVSSRKKPVYSNYGKVEQSKPSPAPAATGTTPATSGSSPATGANSSTTQVKKNAVSPPVAKKKPRRNVERFVEVPVGSGERKRDAQDMINR
jgi:serine/threonine protein kinase